MSRKWRAAASLPGSALSRAASVTIISSVLTDNAASLPEREIAEKAIDATYAFFESIGIPMHLREVGIGPERIDEMAHHIAVNEGLENAYVPLTEQDIKEILVASL
ncbi:MAG: iron-containing alcohol dehydrogenase [Bacteroidales bacterium]|nr:iron-containing alcohol dehydrogenase [Bacteroidales bacterium]